MHDENRTCGSKNTRSASAVGMSTLNTRDLDDSGVTSESFNTQVRELGMEVFHQALH
jgi:hypothetical protein